MVDVMDSFTRSASWGRGKLASFLPSRDSAGDASPRSTSSSGLHSAEEGEELVRQALVPASLFTSLLGEHALIAVDARPLVIHALHGLDSAGITRAVVVLGKGAEDLASALRLEHFDRLKVECLFGDADINWGTSLANSIMAARAAFDENGGPLLIVRSDYLYDWGLLHKMARARFVPGVDAFALVDTAQETLEWISGAHCKAHCKNGHCHGRLKTWDSHRLTHMEQTLTCHP